MKPGAILAVWCYGLIKSSDIDINSAINTFYKITIGSYWDPERGYIDEMYQTIPFPYKDISTPAFKIVVSWNKAQLLGYFRTWSAVMHYRSKHGKDPVEIIESELSGMNESDLLEFSFPIGLRVGRKPFIS